MENPMQLLVEEYPNATFELTHWLVKALNDGDPIVESAMDYIAGNCLKVSTFEQQKAMLNGFGRALIKRGHPSSQRNPSVATWSLNQRRCRVPRRSSRVTEGPTG